MFGNTLAPGARELMQLLDRCIKRVERAQADVPLTPRQVDTALAAAVPQSLEATNAAILKDMREGDQSWRETCVDRYLDFLGTHIVNCNMRVATLRQIPGTRLVQQTVVKSLVEYQRAVAYLRAAKQLGNPVDLEPMELRLRANAWLDQYAQR